jgi:hypothetical protein
MKTSPKGRKNKPKEIMNELNLFKKKKKSSNILDFGK